MNNQKLNEITRNFFLNEGQSQKPSLVSYIETVIRILDTFVPKSPREKRLYEIVKHHMKEIKNSTKKLLNEIEITKEQLKLLQEENQE